MTLVSGDILVYDGNNWVNSSYTSYTKVALTQPAPATTSNGLLNLGDGGFDTGSAPKFAGRTAAGTVLALNTVAGFTGDMANFQVAGVSVFRMSYQGQTICDFHDAGTTNFPYPLQVRHTSTGTPAAGFGVGIQFFGQDTATPNQPREIGAIRCRESQTGSGTGAGGLSSYFTFSQYSLGSSQDAVQIQDTGELTALKDFRHQGTNLAFFNVTPAARQTGGAATAGATYGSTEQSMLQKAYDCLRTFGLLT